MRSEMQTASSRIWSQNTDFIRYEDVCYAIYAVSLDIYLSIHTILL